MYTGGQKRTVHPPSKNEAKHFWSWAQGVETFKMFRCETFLFPYRNIFENIETFFVKP